MKTYELFCAVDKNISGLISQIKKSILHLKQNPNQPLSFYVPAIPQKSGTRLIILFTDIKSLDSKLKRAVNFLESDGSVRFLPTEKIFITDHNLKPGKTIFLFPGFGSEFPEMLTGLSSRFKTVSKWINIFEELYQNDKENYSISKEKWLSSIIKKKNYGISARGPLGSIASLAFNDILCSLNIECHAMIGHSNGENAALISSGKLKYNSKEDLIKILQLLIEFPELKNKHGVYLAVSNLSKRDIDKLLSQYPNKVYMAMNNCPGQQVLYTKLDVRESVIDFIKKRYGLVFDLITDHPYHTDDFKDSLGYLESIYNQFQINNGNIPVYSCVTSQIFPDDEEEIKNLAIRQWLEPVDFEKTIKRAYDQGARTFIEIGPNNRLSGFVLDSLKRKNILMLNCSKENTSALNMIIEMCAKLWVNNHRVDLSYFINNGESTLDENNIVFDSKFKKNNEKIFEGHQELMQQFLKSNNKITTSFLKKLKTISTLKKDSELYIDIDNLMLRGKYQKTDSGIVFTGNLDIFKHTLIKDHSMGGVLPVVPFTISLELLVEIAALVFGSNNKCLSVYDSTGNQWLDFEKNIIDLKIIANQEFTEKGEKVVAIEVYKINNKLQSNIIAFQGKVRLIKEIDKLSMIELGEVKNRPSISVSNFYKNHLFHGTCFKSLYHVKYWNNQGVHAIFKMPDLTHAIDGVSFPKFFIPGPMLDGTGQLMSYWLYEQGIRNFAIFPFYLGSFQQFSKFPSMGDSLLCKATISKKSSVVSANFEFIDMEGNCIGKLTNFKLRLFIHDWIPPLLMNKLNHGNPKTLNSEFLNDGGGIWRKILSKIIFDNEQYNHLLNILEIDQIHQKNNKKI